MEDISHTRRVADTMAEPERPNFDLVGIFFGEDDENDILENVMQNALQELESTKKRSNKAKNKLLGRKSQRIVQNVRSG